jgi:hypothetical protein
MTDRQVRVSSEGLIVGFLVIPIDVFVGADKNIISEEEAKEALRNAVNEKIVPNALEAVKFGRVEVNEHALIPPPLYRPGGYSGYTRKRYEPITVDKGIKSISIRDDEYGVNDYINENPLEKLIEENPDTTHLEISFYKNKVHIPDNIGTLKNLRTLALTGFENLPDSVFDIPNLELVSLKGTDVEFDVSKFNDVDSLQVLNLIQTPNAKGYKEMMSRAKVLVVVG